MMINFGHTVSQFFTSTTDHWKRLEFRQVSHLPIEVAFQSGSECHGDVPALSDPQNPASPDQT